MTDMHREAFERLASSEGTWGAAVRRDAKGDYVLMSTSSQWHTWQDAMRYRDEQEKGDV